MKAVQAFVTKDNINGILQYNGVVGEIGLLSIDIDGNDYWIWEAIDVIQPRVVVCEYNSIFGPSQKVSISYSSNFTRGKAHYSHLYFGASLAAFCHLAEKKGYDFIGTAGAGVNAFFVRKDISQPFITYKAEENFRMSANRDSKDSKGNNNFLLHNERLPMIRNMQLVDVTTNNSFTIADLYKL